MLLTEIIKKIKVLDVKGDINIEISSLSQNTKNIKENCLFFCYKGENYDGHDFVLNIIKKSSISCSVVK